MTKRRKTVNDPGLPGAPTIHGTDKVFQSADEMAISIDGLIRCLNRRYSKKRSLERGSVLGFIIEKMTVSFTETVREIDIQTDFARGTMTILAPIVSGESENERSERRIGILKAFLPTMKEAQLRATLQLYRTLNLAARKGLIAEFGGKASGRGSRA